jgi:osmoprotectant transport system permease protein
VGARAEGHDVTLLYDSFKPSTFPDAFRFMWDNPHLMLSKTVEHLQISGIAMGLALVLAIPLGVWLGHLHRGSFVAINGSNLLRALPSLAVISIFLPSLGIGHTVVVIALVVLAAPLILTNAYVAVDGVDTDIVEAARGMGLTALQVLLRVELPLALPLIFAGIRTGAVYVVATATLAGVVGGGSLGDIIFNQPTYFLSGVIGAAIVVSLLAFAAYFLFFIAERLLTPRGLRHAGAVRLGEEEPPVVMEAAVI